MYSVILLSGGRGCRMQESTPKQYLLLCGKPMIMHSIERFDIIDQINEIVIVCDNIYVDNIKQMLHEYNVETPTVFANSGATRQESVYNGLCAATNKNVLIHEAARPFVRVEEFQQIINDESENISYGYNIPYTVLKGNSTVEGILNRSELINVQLPQKFNRDLLLQAHEVARSRGDIYTEDASLLFDIFHTEISIIKGTSYNLKITEPIDLLMGEIIYRTYIINRS